MLPIIAIMSSVLATITKVAVTIGPMLVKHAALLLEVGGKYLPQIIKTIETVSTVLNLISPDERAEELGEKAMQADKKPEDFDDINAYINYLRDHVSIDKTTLSNEKIDVMTRQAIGASLLVKGVSETLGTELTLPFIKTVSQLGLDANVIIEVVKAYSTAGLNLDDYENYITEKLPTDQLDKHSDVLITVYQKADPSLSLEQAEDLVMDLALPKSS